MRIFNLAIKKVARAKSWVMKSEKHSLTGRNNILKCPKDYKRSNITHYYLFCGLWNEVIFIGKRYLKEYWTSWNIGPWSPFLWPRNDHVFSEFYFAAIPSSPEKWWIQEIILSGCTLVLQRIHFPGQSAGTCCSDHQDQCDWQISGHTG